ncbi:MAG: TonB-dependent receptor [Proteobacteria bacterium]|nr:TonB-dependent receptor [Pseudomonadota bacterium]
MFRPTLLSRALMVAFGSGLALGVGLAQAQDSQRIEITGSSIKRIDAETALPVTVVKMDDLKSQGVTTVEQVMATLTAVQIQTGSSQQVGSSSGGAALADLRGIGASKTLVLLNGRRIANNAIDGSAPDLNMIPFAALERVEVLRDGASSLYGTDAIGGVINFITRKDFRGGIITIGADVPQASGGKSAQANVGFGFGDLSNQGFNVFGFIDVNKQDPIGGTQRPFNERFPGGLSPTPFPANYYQDGSVTGNPAAPGCSNPSYLVPAGDGSSCYIATSRFVDYTPKAERTSAMLRGNLRLGNDHNLALEWFGTENKTTTRIAPVPYGTLYMNPFKPDGSANPYYPGNAGSGFTPNIPLDPNYTVANMNPRPGVTLQPGFIIVKWRALAGGSRTDISDNKQQRVLAQLDGVIGGWDYQAGVSFNENKVRQDITGYTDGNIITQGMLNGIINPFGAQDAAGDAFIQSALTNGTLQNHRGRVTTFDGKVSREFGDWFGAGRNAALAIGAERRHENFRSAANTAFAELVVSSTGVDPTSLSEGTRNVSALYGEFSLPLLKSLDLTLAARYDKYSDFGNTTNPKVSLRYQPSKALLVRAAYSTGFRAPSLYELNASQAYTNTGTVSDPVNCPNGTTAIPGKSTSLNCNVQFQRLTGGNTELKPEKSKNYGFGIVLEPMPALSVGLDFWWIKLRDTIAALSENTVLGDPATFARYINRNAAGDLSIDGFSCPGADCGYLDLRQQNLGGTRTNGVDLSASYRLELGQMGRVNMGLNSTYVTKYEYQDYANGPWNQNVGVYSGAGPIFRWQHALAATWSISGWTLGAVAHYKSGYVDQDPSNTVSNYATLDTYVTWAGIKNLSVTLGVNNATNREPPYSNQGEVFQANYDPRFADPTGRKYYARASYKF